VNIRRLEEQQRPARSGSPTAATTYNHMSAVGSATASRSRGPARGAHRTSGWRRPHLHFEVWIGPIGTVTRQPAHTSGLVGRPQLGLRLVAGRPSANRDQRPPAATMTSMFLDRVTVFVRAGDGGDGAATFRRERPRGEPDKR
jgi:hypothetical protein